MTAARLLVFDLDGTLIDSSLDLANAVNAALERMAPGSPPLPVGRVRSLIGSGATSLVTRSLEAARLPLSAEAVLPVFLDCYRERLLETTRLYPGVAEALARLADRTLAVLTNKPGDMSRTILAGLGVARRFARIWGADDVPARKPDSAGLVRLMAELGAAAGETVIVGDSAVDVRAGRAAGVTTVGVRWGLDPEGLEAEAPDLMLDDLGDLPTVLP